MKNRSVKIFLACMFIGLLAGFMYAGAKKTTSMADNQVLQINHRIVTESDVIDQANAKNKIIAQKGTSYDIKFERSTKIKTGMVAFQKKLAESGPPYTGEQYPFTELHPTRFAGLDILPHDTPDIKTKRIGETWHKPQENLYVKGEMLIQLHNDMRDKVSITITDGSASFTVPKLDVLNYKYGVFDISRVIKENLPQGEEFGLDLIFLMKVPEDMDLEAVSQEYRNVSGVKEVSPNYLPFLHEADNIPRTIPNDPYYDWSDSIVKGPECWAIPRYGSNTVRISILDIERLYETHADLSGNYLGFKGGTTGSGDHGTMCASVACARLNNSTGMSGLCGGWNTTQGVRWTGYVFTSASDNITAITWSVNTASADILSESIGFGGNPAGLESAFEWAWSQGVISFASAGNDAANPEPGWPAYYGIVVAVGGCDATGQLWDWGNGVGSNIGEWVDIIAPGDAQYCCSSTGYTTDYGGTSFATPAVAAIAGLMLSDNPSLTPTQIRERLIRAADYNEHKSPEYAGLMGAGIANCYEAVEIYNTNVSVNEMVDVPASPPAYISIHPKAVVQNRGTGLATFNVVAQATLFGVAYADTVQVSNLPPNNEYTQNAEIVEFKQWNPAAGTYSFKIFATMTGDQNRVNDTLQTTINVVPPSSGSIDTLVYDTNAPAWYFNDANYYWAVRCSPEQPCSVLSINFFSQGAGNYYLYTWNDASGLPGTVKTGPQTYANSTTGWKDINITGHPFFSGDFHIGFQCPGGAGGPWVIADNGPGTGRSKYSANGTSWNTFSAYNWCIRAIVKYPPSGVHDVSMQSIVTPTTHQITAMPVIPSVIIKNLGSSAETGFNVTMKIDSSGQQIYTDTKAISKTLGKFDADTVTFAGWMPNWNGGTYICSCYTQLGTDQDRSNDTLTRDVLCSNTDTLAIDDGTARWYSGDSFYAASRFSIERPGNITGIMYYMWRRRGNAQTPNVVPCTLFVWDNASGDPGTQMHSGAHTPVTAVSTEITEWLTYNMALTPVSVNPGDFWIGIWTPGMVGFNNPGSDSTFEYILFDNETDTYRTKSSFDKTTWNTRTFDCMIRPIVQYTGSVNSHDVMTKEIDEPGMLVSTLREY
ncbi:S8 family serine peptidase, partial [candidate division WOR-3 bacterium]|nr:S8 family serine peptidase [candidate division WOR-3 bacterium]